MSLAYLFDSNIQFQDKSGNNNVNGFLRVYIDNTDDRAVTYKDFNGTLNQADIRLDNNGRAVVIVDDSKTYRLEVYGTTGVLLWTLYPISPKATGINETLEALVAAVKSHTIAIEGLALGKKNKQQAKVISGTTTQTVKSITQDADGEINVEFEDIDFPYNIQINSPDDSIEVGTPVVDPEREEETIPISVKRPGLVKADSADTEPGTLIDKLEVVDNVRDPQDAPLLSLETTVDGQGNRKVGINEDNLQRVIRSFYDDVGTIIDVLDDMDFDEVPHGSFGSSLNQSPGDGTSTSIQVSIFRPIEATVGDAISWTKTTEIGGEDFGTVTLEPGTYIICSDITCQWVGVPAGTYLPQVGNVLGESFDFSQQQEVHRRTTNIVTVSTTTQFKMRISFDAATPVMGFWINSAQIVKIAGGMSQTNVAHDSTLTGKGSVAEPLGVNNQVVAQNALAGNVAPEFVPNETNAVAGLPYMYGGKLYVAKTDYNGAWDASKFELTSVYDLFYNKRFIEDESLIIIDKSKMFISGDITDAGDIGDTVDLTVTPSNWKCLVLDCKEGDYFFIRGSAGEGPRLWCFVDGDNKIVSISDGSAATGAEGLRITAPADGKVIFNSGAAAGIGGPYFKSILSSQEFYESVQNDLTEFKAETLVIGDITTNVGVGNVVNLTPSSDATYRNFVKECSKGDSFLIKGIGGNSPRLWCFVDENNKVVSVSANGASSGESGLLVLAPVDGKIIFNTSVNAYSGDIFFKVLNNALDVIRVNLEATSKHVDSLDGLTVVKKDVLSPYNYDRGYITTNVGVGNVVDLTPDYDRTYVFVVRDCKQGEEFYIRGNGGSTPRLWCFVDENNKVISASEAYATTGENGSKIVAPADGKVIFNSGANPAYGAPYFKVKTNSQEYVNEKTGKIENSILSRLHHEIHRDDAPYSGLPEELTGVTIDASHIMEDIYGKFDTLCDEYSDYIEKFDAATLTGLEYPVYANGVQAGDPTYLETPAYKTYAYHIYDGRQNPQNVASFPKKKILIVGTIHGHEFLAGLNLFALACHIVKNISGDLFDILSAFDIWLIPFVNGYGIYHGTRYNANGVDVNRNFGTRRWTSSGAGTPTYTGATPDYEFETKLVEGMYGYVSPDMYFDHHCSPGRQAVQIYTETPSVNFLTRSYQSLVNFSKAMVKNFPEYFGTKYHLLRDNTTYSGALPTAINPMQGCSDEWYYEHGVESCTLEVMGHINYLNGEYNAAGEGAENTDLLVINEFVLRSQLVDYLPIVLQ